MDASFDPTVIKNCRNAIITYILNGAATKLPLKERDMMVIIDRKGKLFHEAFQQATEALQKFYGICVESIPNIKTGKSFICYNEDNIKSLLMYDKEQKSQITLLFIILSYIFMKSSPTNDVTEEQLIQFLHSIKIDIDAEHEFFGANLRKLITETFVKQLYLKRERVISDLATDVKYNYSWGYRADREFDKKLVFETTAKILKRPPRLFVTKYQEIYGCDTNTEQQMLDKC